MRTAKDISQEAVAKHLDVTRSSIANFEGGRQRLSLHSIYAYAEFLEAEVRGLFPSFDELVQEDEEDGTMEIQLEGRSVRVPKHQAEMVKGILEAFKGETP